MRFAKHSDLTGQHALLSPSSYHWINYSDEKLRDWFDNRMQAALGSRKHDFAKEAIELRQKQPDTGQTLSSYVNDCIGFRMNAEQILYFSPIFFGTADAIRFDEEDKLLRIFDLKTGVTKASFKQLEVYAALFCLEYGFKPSSIKIELRIYQNDDVQIYIPDVHDITFIMDRIKTFDLAINEMKQGAYS